MKVWGRWSRSCGEQALCPSGWAWRGVVRYDVSIGVSRGSRCNDDYYRSMKVVVAGVIRVVVVIPSGTWRSTTGDRGLSDST